QPTPPPKSPSAPPPAPDPGTCRALDFADIGSSSNAAKEVPCAEPHTAYTFAVPDLPDDIAFEGVDVKNEAVQTFAADVCQDKYASFVGGDAARRALARLSATYFVPDQGAFDLGAQWVRCDVVALRSAGMLATLPRELEGVLDEEDALDQLGLCSQGAPGAEGSTLVMCSEEHSYRALAALRLGGTGSPYPGPEVAGDGGKQRCEDLVRETVGADKGFTYGWTYPSTADWQSGQRFGYCWLENAR
ncbi:MAG: septum formation family protein, partial [Nocardioidaceae bacterium]